MRPTLGSTWFQGQLIGNPVPSIMSINAGAFSNDAVTVTKGGQRFTFSQVDLWSTAFSQTNYTFTGTLLGASVFNVDTPIVPPIEVFITVLSGVSADVIDSLVITAHVGIESNSTNIDNIVVTPVAIPEPTVLAMLATSLALLERPALASNRSGISESGRF